MEEVPLIKLAIILLLSSKYLIIFLVLTLYELFKNNKWELTLFVCFYQRKKTFIKKEKWFRNEFIGELRLSGEFSQ
jgi:predicted membrane protein